MKKNVGSADRIIRLLLGLVLIILYVMHVFTGTVGFVLLIAGIIIALTSLISFCPIYAILGINTCPVKKGDA